MLVVVKLLLLGPDELVEAHRWPLLVNRKRIPKKRVANESSDVD